MYRSKDIDYMNDLKKRINEQVYYANADNFQDSWEYMRRFIVLDDLNVFLRLKFANSQIKYIPEYVYNNNLLNPDYMFVTVSENPKELEILNSIINKAGITSYYRTSYIKHSNLLYYEENENLSAVISSEIKTVKPKYVIFFGLNIADWSCNIKDRHKPIFTNDNIQMIATSSILDLLSNSVDEKSKLAMKHLIWKDVNLDIPF